MAAAKQFSALEEKMDQASTKIEAAASHDGQAARTMSLTGQVVMGALLLAAAAFAAVLMVAARRGLVSPLLAVTSALRRLAAGDLNAALPKKTGGDELGQMTEALHASATPSRPARRSWKPPTCATPWSASAARPNVAADEAEAAQTAVVDNLAQALRRLSEGDLSHRIDRPYPRRLRAPARRLQRRRREGRLVIAASLEATSMIHGGSRERSPTPPTTCRAGPNSAASLEQTAAALDEITSTAQDRRRRPGSAGGRARPRRRRGQRDHRRSGRRSHGRDREILQPDRPDHRGDRRNRLPDQPAGPERRRRGRAGGRSGPRFAVVAQEVRALAQRSAEAAKEIKTLIAASASEVGLGVDHVGKAGEALRLIAAEVEQIDDLVRDMAASARSRLAAWPRSTPP
jgi:methyl-accepting chemotaxis protein